MGCCIAPKPQNHSQIPSSSQRNNPVSAKYVSFSTNALSTNYEKIKVLGEGAFGSVNLVLHRPTGLKRAAKQIRITLDTKEKDIMEEINIMRMLDHPSIIKVIEIFKSQSHFDIVMELCTGGELFDKITEQKSFSENTAARYLWELISALNYMHANSIVHRDLKPENLLLQSEASNSSIKLADFGTATRIEPNEKLTMQIGTCYYIAPEVLSGSYNEKCDVWSTGIIMYILLCGSPPFNARSEPEIYKKILSEPVKFPDKEWHSISAEAKGMITMMLEKNFRLRPGFPEILKHPWLQRANNQVPDRPIAIHNLTKLSAFNTQDKLQRATLAFISSQLLTQEELKEISTLFEQMDKNKDGMLSKEELAAGFRDYGVNIGINMDELMNQCDEDGNGYVNYNEFIVATVDWSKTLSRQKLYEAFKVYDIDGNGSISLSEMMQGLGSDDDHLFMEIIREADTNEDGEIDFEEFSEYMMRKLSRNN